MRIFLIAISFINTLFYVLVYTYYDNILGLFGNIAISAGLQNFLKTITLIIVGFCIGVMVMLLLNIKSGKSYFDLKNLLLIGIIPFILVILSLGPVSSFILSRLLSENERIRELVFYLLSMNVLWSIWVGFALGTSVRPNFGRRSHKHANTHVLSGDNVRESKEESL